MSATVSNGAERRVRTWPCRDNDDKEATEATGYVTACCLACAQDVAERINHTLEPDAEARAEDEDERGVCDSCYYPDPDYCEDMPEEGEDA